MLKKINTILLILLITVSSFALVVKADTPNSTETVSKVTVKANVNNFKGEIYFFINDSKDKKRVFVLNKENGFSSTYQLPTGEAKILDIKFYDTNSNQIKVSYDYNGTLNTTADKEAILTINVNGILTDNNSTDQNATDQNATDQNTINQNVTDQNNTDKTKENVTDGNNKRNSTDQNNTINNQIKNSKGTIINLIIDVILIALSGGIVLFMKYKEIKKRK